MNVFAQNIDDPLAEMCSDELCSHVYRDLEGYLQPLCERGEYIIIQEQIMPLADETEIKNLSLSSNNPKIGFKVGMTPGLSHVTYGGSTFINSWWHMGHVNDGNKTLNSYLDFGYTYNSSETEASLYLQADLGAVYDIDAINLYRYFSDNRMYRGTVIAVAEYEDDFENNKKYVEIVYNSDSENYHGFGAGTDDRYQETETGKKLEGLDVAGRYVRVYVHGATTKDGTTHQCYTNHIVELEIMGKEPVNDDPYANKGIYFTSIPDLYEESIFENENHFTIEDITQVNAVFRNGEGDEQTYRMIELQNGIFSTVVPPKLSDKSIYQYITFEIYGADGTLVDTVTYNFVDEENPVDHLSVSGEGSFMLVDKIRNCYYWTQNHLTSYWSGQPSTADQLLDEQAIYVNKGDVTGWDEIWVSYEKDGKIISEQVTKFTRSEDVIYYLFEAGSGVSENTLLSISNCKILENGTFSVADGAQQIFTMYNIASEDNYVVLKNIARLDRIWGVYLAEGTRYVAFRDQAYGQGRPYALIGGADANYENLIQYRVGVDAATTENATWTNMIQHTNTSWNVDLYKLFFTDVKIDEANKYIQFRILNGLESTSTELYSTDVLEIDDSYAYPCFFADIYQKANSSYQGVVGKISGAWTSIYRSNFHGDESSEIIKQENTSYEKNIYYAKANFYDLYTEYELQGNKLATATEMSGINGTMYKNDGILATVNQAFSDYYRNQFTDIKTYPFYMGSRAAILPSGTYRSNESKDAPDLGYRMGYNQWAGGGLHIAYGYVDKQLNANGDMTSGGVVYPQFNESFIRGDNSLNTALGYVYKDVTFPFIHNSENGYWEFNSAYEEYGVTLKEDPNLGYYLDLDGIGLKRNEGSAFGGNKYEFYPFSMGTVSGQKKVENLNSYSTMKMELKFHITENGTIKVKDELNPGNFLEEDIIFKFSGDDDFLAFIDGHLALDIAGVHDPLYGEINFNTGEVVNYEINNSTYKPNTSGNKIVQTNLYEITDVDGNKVFSKGALSNGEHTLTVFYMDRGGLSNLMLSFNFPRSDKMTISNKVDMSSANPAVFRQALENMGNFRYYVAQQATSGAPLGVEQAAGYLSSTAIEFNDFSDASYYKGSTGVTLETATGLNSIISTNRDNIVKLKNKAGEDGLSYNDMVDRILRGEEYWTTIESQTGVAVDLSGMEYLRIPVYSENDDVTMTNGYDIYVRLVDENGNMVQASADQLNYGTFTNTIVKKKWSVLRLDLKKLIGSSSYFDVTKVKKVQLAYAKASEQLLLDDLDFRSEITEYPATGFSVAEEQISDYGSLKNVTPIDYLTAELKPILGAWYILSDIGNTNLQGGSAIMVPLSGEVELAGNEKAVFADKFREGSYLQIKQNNDTKMNAVFRTKWSILENARYDSTQGKYVQGYINDNWLANYSSQVSVANDANILDNTITNVECDSSNSNSYYASDDRNVLVDSSREIEYIYPSGNRDPHVSGENNTLVYRSYFNPDNTQKSNIDLTVAYENELISGGIVITKKLTHEDSRIAEREHKFKFHVHYKNIAGLDLEDGIDQIDHGDDNEGVYQEIEIVVPPHAGEDYKYVSVAIYGIPKNTTYTVHEVSDIPEDLEVGELYAYNKPTDSGFVDYDWTRPTETISTNPHNVQETTHVYRVGTVNVTYPVLEGVADESLQELIFTNEQPYPLTEIKIEKTLTGGVSNRDRDYVFHVHAQWTVGEGAAKQDLSKVVTTIVTVPAGQTSGYAVVDEFPVGTLYQVHELDESELIKAETGECYEINIITPEVKLALDDGMKHKIDTSVLAGTTTTRDNQCKDVKNLFSYVTGNNSRQIFKFTNNGPKSIVVQKEDNFGKPLINSGFTLYDSEGKVAEAQTKTQYYKKVTIASTDGNYIKDINAYKVGEQYYTVYILNDSGNAEYVYYVPMTDAQIADYIGNGAVADDVVALVIFDELRNETYSIKETSAPPGYTGLDKDKSFGLTFNAPSAQTGIIEVDVGSTVFARHDSHNIDAYNAQFTVSNRLNKGQFVFYKENRDGERLQGVIFALYRKECTDNHDNTKLKYQAGTYQPTDTCWTLIGTVTTAANGYVAFPNLSAEENAEYRLVEISSVSDYVTPKGQWRVKYDKGLQTFSAFANVDNPPAFSGTGTADDPFIVRNYKLTDLPSSGGRGWAYTVGAGMMCAMMAYWGYLFMRKAQRKYKN